MSEETNRFRIKNRCRTMDNDKNDIEFDKIVEFLNAHEAVMDYAGLN